jgi:hypothetical protein
MGASHSWRVVPKRPGCAVGLRASSNLVSQGCRAGQRRRAIWSWHFVRQRPRRASGFCASCGMV